MQSVLSFIIDIAFVIILLLLTTSRVYAKALLLLRINMNCLGFTRIYVWIRWYYFIVTSNGFHQFKIKNIEIHCVFVIYLIGWYFDLEGDTKSWQKKAITMSGMKYRFCRFRTKCFVRFAIILYLKYVSVKRFLFHI